MNEVPGEVFESAIDGQADLYEGRLVIASFDKRLVVDRLWVQRSGDDRVLVLGQRHIGDPGQDFRLVASAQ